MYIISLIIVFILGGIIGFTCAALCNAAKEADERMCASISNDLENCYTKPLAAIELYNFKETLKSIMKSDISLYQRLYQKSNNIYYLGRIKQCEFLLGLIEGKKKNEIGKS